MNDEQQLLGKIVKFLSRNLRLILLCLLGALVVGLAVYLLTPKSYKSSALIIYQQQQVNPGKMTPEVQTQMLEMVNNVGQQVVSRSNLEGIIVANNLYPELRKSLPMEDVVVAMRSEHITIEPTKGKTNTFLVFFTGDDPRQVMVTTNSLASKFIEENIRYREQRAKDTSAYVKDELAMAKASMDKQEQSMRDYKLQYYNAMPDQSAANIARLTSLQTQDQEIQNNIQEFKRSQILIQEQITLRGVTPLGTPASELTRVQQELEILKGRYTENHPDVKRLQAKLAALTTAPSGTEGAESQTVAAAADTRIAPLEKQHKDIDFSISRLERDREATRQQINRLQGWISMTPVREAEWTALTRDYNQLQQHYQALVARSLEADSAELMENRQKGSQFKILEPALMPSKPFSPNFAKIMLVAALLGLGLGLGLGYGKDFLDTSFSNVKDLESYLGQPVTCSIPVLQTAKEKEQFRVRNIIWGAALGAGFLIMGIIMLLLWWKGKIIL